MAYTDIHGTKQASDSGFLKRQESQGVVQHQKDRLRLQAATAVTAQDA